MQTNFPPITLMLDKNVFLIKWTSVAKQRLIIKVHQMQFLGQKSRKLTNMCKQFM